VHGILPGSKASGRRKPRSRLLRGFWTYLALLWLVVYCLFPLAWMISTSLKPTEDTYVIPPLWIPPKPTLQSYRMILGIQNFAQYFLNSGIVSLSTTVLAMIFAGFAGYGFARFRFRGSRALMIFTLMTQMFPGILLVIPYFAVMSATGLLNTYPALVIAYTSFSLPFCTWMLKGFFDSIPAELDEAAMIDGCSRTSAFLRVILPLSAPGLVATAIFSFLVAWNEFLFAVVLTSTPDMYLVTVGIASNIGQFRVQWNDLMAASVLATLPTIILYAFLERYLVQGLTAGAVKG
jgi:ABC-type glycerol-3-phosphate transport system permease component